MGFKGFPSRGACARYRLGKARCVLGKTEAQCSQSIKCTDRGAKEGERIGLGPDTEWPCRLSSEL